MKFKLLLLSLVFTSGCGAPGSSGGSFKATLDWIRQNGLPSFSMFFPGLPSQFAAVDGVATDASGLPSLPTNLDQSVIAGASPDFAALLAEAKVLSTQGFSEARRFEALVQGLVAPVFEMTGQKNLFAAVGGGSSDDALNLLDASQGASIFDQLYTDFSFAVGLGQNENSSLPSHLVLSASPSSEFITISGVWPDQAGGGYNTGISLALKLLSSDDMEMSVALAPGLAKGIVSGWTGTNCGSDVWQLSLKKAATLTSAQISALECADTTNRISALELGFGASGLAVSGGFSQNFAEAKDGSLRHFLGKRQGFVLQAAASSALDQVAAAAAVLTESDMAGADQSSVDRFGVGQLLTDFVQSKYWNTRMDDVSGNFIPTGSDLENIAYWTCSAPGVATAIQSEVSGTSTLCARDKIDAESMVQTMVGLKPELDGDSSVGESVKRDVGRIVDILSIRNTMFVGSDSSVVYKSAPNEAFATLDTARTSVALPALDDTTWKEKSQMSLRPLSALPMQAFGVNLGALNNFVSGKCTDIVGSAQEKAGEARDTAARCSR